MKFIKNFSLTIISLFLSLLILEVFLVYFMPQARNSSWRVQDESGSFFNIQNGKAQHEFIGKKEKISVNYKFGEFHNRIYKNFETVDIAKKKILILGDSNIFGWLLEDDETFVLQLQELFNKYYFVNASAGGWSDVDMYNYLKKNCSKVEPEFIILFLEIDRSISTNAIYFDKEKKLNFKKIPVNNLKKYLNNKYLYNFLSENSHLFQIIKTLYVNLSNENYINFVKKNNTNTKKVEKKINNKIDYNQKLDLFFELINLIQYEAEKCKSNIIYIDRGWYKKKQNSKIKNLVFEKFYNLKLKNEINFISLYHKMSGLRIDINKYLLEEGHPNSKANKYKFKILAKELKNYLL